MRVTEAQNYDEARDSISHDWVELLQRWDMAPHPIPNGLRDTAGYLEAIAPNLIILTGGDDPGRGDRRDLTEKAVLNHAEANTIPVLGVCRGLQVINLYFGGDLGSVSGHISVEHAVHFTENFSRFYGEETSVNSFHAASISANSLAPDLVSAGIDHDGNVEAAYHNTLPIAGIMWHPERPGAPVADRSLFDHLIDEGVF